MEYKFTVTEVRTYSTDGFQDVIKEADWILEAHEEGFSYNVATTSKFPEPTTAERFTPFNQVTEAQLKGWIEDTQEYKNARVHVTEVVEKQVQRQQLIQKTPPWMTTTTAP